MAPLQWIGQLFLPGWWACAIGQLSAAPAAGATRAARAPTRTIAFDTTGLARVINRLNPLVPLRAVLLRHVPPLRGVDWQIRKFFWTLHWCSVTAFQG